MRQNQYIKIMTDSFNDFLSLPCWFTIPLVAAYLSLAGYVVYLLWQLRRQRNLL